MGRGVCGEDSPDASVGRQVGARVIDWVTLFIVFYLSDADIRPRRNRR